MRMYFWGILPLIVTVLACERPAEDKPAPVLPSQPFVTVLGVAQDAGYPQAACQKACCQAYRDGQVPGRSPACLGLLDPQSGKKWLFEATPHIGRQLEAWQAMHRQEQILPDGIFLTHAHIGHYTGLMQLGREVIGSPAVPVYALPRMQNFLRTNGPWSQLVALDNIRLQSIQEDTALVLNDRLRVTALLVPHRDEFSETAGFLIEGPTAALLFIPDIDKWEKWSDSLEQWLSKVDYALLDGTFFKNGELPNRDMSEIPHPFIEETMTRLQALPEAVRQKVYFIHFNHTNPVIWDASAQAQVRQAGFNLAEEGQWIPL